LFPLMLFHWVVSFATRITELVVHYTLGVKDATSAAQRVVPACAIQALEEVEHFGYTAARAGSMPT